MEFEVVKEEIRDEVMKNMLSIPSNQSCFDCGNKRPRWASPYLGIVICMECAGRHRSYGTHISFVKSVDLDKWNKKQLKSLELTGNLYMKKQFEKLNIPKIESIYDYNNKLILKIRKDIEDLVKQNLKPDDYSSIEQIKKKENENNYKQNEIKNNNNNNEKENKKIDEVILKPIKFNMKKNESSIKKEKKKNKIKRLDMDFDFDNFKMNDSKSEKKDKENNIDTGKIKGMKISRFDKKKALIEERNKKKDETDKGPSICEKIMDYIYYIFCFLRNKS